MPQIVYETRDFPAGVLPHTSPVIDPAMLELMTAATRVGDPGIFTGHKRPLAELQWRGAMIDASLIEVVGGTKTKPDLRWAKSASFSRLDPSEKTSISYFLGMLQATVVAKELLGVSDIVHVDAVLELRGIPLKKGRPDLVGYRTRPADASSLGRVLIEAKGRTNGSDADALRKAKKQVKDTGSVARRLVGRKPLLVASMAYFTDRGDWRGIYVDPPAGDEVDPLVEDDAVFQGLLNIASIRPVVDAIAQLREFAPERIRVSRGSEMIIAALPGQDLAFGVPTEVFNRVLELTGPPDDPRPVDDRRAAEWAQSIGTRRQLAPVLRERVGIVHEDEFAGFHLDEDGILSAALRPEPELG